LALSWIVAMLIPTLVTTGAPNFTRALGALPMVFALPGLAVEWLLFRLPRLAPVRNFKRMSRVTDVLIGAALIGALGINAASTWDDYFNQWPNHPETQFVFQADFAAIAKDIDASGATKVYVGGLSNDTLDDSSLYLLRACKDVQVGWFDSGSPISSGGALLDWFTGGPTTYIPSIVPISPRLMANLSNARCIETVATERYRRYQTHCGGTPGIPPSARWFEDTAIFVGASGDVTQTLRPGEARQFITTWRAADPIVYPRSIFVHLVNPQTGRIIAQHDGLDSPTKYWQPHDYITQMHTLSIPADAAPGLYELWVGLYNPTNGQRVLQRNLNQSQPPTDHVVLGQIEIVR
jgi:hypothetical protein